jgi:hypothetical protein
MKRVISLHLLAAILFTACKAPPTPTQVPTATSANAAQFETVRAHIEHLVAKGEVP